MSLTITELLGTDSMSGTRFTINANFDAIKTEIDTIEGTFGLSLTAGNIDVSTASGGQIKAKVGAFNSLQLPAAGTPNITLTGSTGAIVGKTLTVDTSITTPTLNITLGGTFLNQGSSQFDGTVVFNDLTTFVDGIAYGKIDVGVTNSHTVLNTDRIILFDGITSPAILTLTADPSLVDGHTITLVKYGTGPCDLDTTDILGFSTGTISFATDPYKSTITLTYDVATGKWIITASSNMTIV